MYHHTISRLLLASLGCWLSFAGLFWRWFDHAVIVFVLAFSYLRLVYQS
jgi:hypothetical protein